MQSEKLLSSTPGRIKLGSRGIEFPALMVASGQRIAVAGKNGAGKSVLLRHLMGWIKPQAGNFLSPLWNQPGKLAWYTNQRNPYLDLLVEDVLWMGIVNKDPERLMHISLEYELNSLMGKSVQWLSDGEWVRLMMARIALQLPKLVILDEPTAHLDFIYKEKWKAWVTAWCNEGVSVICATHDVDWMIAEANEIWWIEGEKLAICSPNEFKGKFKKNDN
jgi:ABC-type Mn2+/Zn2+ transport system ATPase subunit